MKTQYVDITVLGSKFYYSDKAMTVLHREDGPAVEYPNGTKLWYCDGVLHREGGPAAEYKEGIQKWYRYGKLERVHMGNYKCNKRVVSRWKEAP